MEKKKEKEFTVLIMEIRMGDFFNGEHVGKHVTLTKDGELKAEYFSLKL